MLTTKQIKNYIDLDAASEKKKFAKVGLRYYENETDIQQYRIFYFDANGVLQEDKEHFDQILYDITEYDNYCKENPNFKNNMTTLTTQRIKETYNQCLQDKSFL